MFPILTPNRLSGSAHWKRLKLWGFEFSEPVGPQVLNSAASLLLCAWCPARWETGLGCVTGPRWEASLASARLSCGNLCRVAQTVFLKQERAWKGRCLDGSARETSLYLSVLMVLSELLECHFRFQTWLSPPGYILYGMLSGLNAVRSQRSWLLSVAAIFPSLNIWVVLWTVSGCSKWKHWFIIPGRL